MASSSFLCSILNRYSIESNTLKNSHSICHVSFSVNMFMAYKKIADSKATGYDGCTSIALNPLKNSYTPTIAIIKHAAQSEEKSFIIVTEKGVVDRLKRDYPQKEFILVSERAICPNMKWNKLEDILNVLENETNEIDVDAEISEKAYATIERMLKL